MLQLFQLSNKMRKIDSETGIFETDMNQKQRTLSDGCQVWISLLIFNSNNKWSILLLLLLFDSQCSLVCQKNRQVREGSMDKQEN